jgi:hypothetical protein
MLLIAIGGLAAAGGVALGWWDARAIRATEIFGREIMADRTLAGWSGWSGALGLVAGLASVILGVAGALGVGWLPRPRLCHLALVCGLLALAAVAAGLAQGPSVAASALAGLGTSVEASPAGGIVVSGLGALLTAAGGALGRSAGPSVRPG